MAESKFVKADLNHAIFEGAVVGEPTLKIVGNGYNIFTICVGVKRTKKKDDQYIAEMNFFEVRFFGKDAEIKAKFLKKGMRVLIDGELCQERWESDGKKNSRVYIVCNDLHVTSWGKDSKDENRDNPSKNESAQALNSQPTGSYDPAAGFAEDIPF